MHRARHTPHGTGAAAALLGLFACASHADERDFATASPRAGVQTVTRCETCIERHENWQAPPLDLNVGTAQSTWPASPPTIGVAPRSSAPVLPATPNPFAHLRFRDQEPLINRLRRLQALPFLTLWDSGEATVYVGVDRRGKAGLHLRQKRDDRGVRAAQSLASPEVDRPPPRRRAPKSRQAP